MGKEASLLIQANFLLAEGPLWHAERKSFFWVDIEGKTLQECNWHTKEVTTIQLPKRAGLVVPHHNGHLIIAMQGSIALLNIDTRSLEHLADIEKDKKDNRCNDGKCDTDGRLWVGTMHEDGLEGKGSFYCLDHDLQLHKKLENLSIPNGLAWSLDNKRFYHIDSPTYKLQSYFYDAATASITFEKTAVQISEDMGSPDGMAMDEEGMLWVAHWDGFAVRRWNPITGELLDEIKLPVPQITSCAFGGENLDQLFITTASVGLSDDEKGKYPLSGSIFIATPGVKGLPANKFGVNS